MAEISAWLVEKGVMPQGKSLEEDYDLDFEVILGMKAEAAQHFFKCSESTAYRLVSRVAGIAKMLGIGSVGEGFEGVAPSPLVHAAVAPECSQPLATSTARANITTTTTTTTTTATAAAAAAAADENKRQLMFKFPNGCDWREGDDAEILVRGSWKPCTIQSLNVVSGAARIRWPANGGTRRLKSEEVASLRRPGDPGDGASVTAEDTVKMEEDKEEEEEEEEEAEAKDVGPQSGRGKSSRQRAPREFLNPADNSPQRSSSKGKGKTKSGAGRSSSSRPSPPRAASRVRRLRRLGTTN